MLFDIMKHEFIWKLFLSGGFCVLFLILAIREGLYNKNHTISYLGMTSYLSLSFVCATTFIRITAPTPVIHDILSVILYLLIIVSFLLFASKVILFIKLKAFHSKQRFSYTDILDEIDDYIIILDEKGELAAHNVPKNKEPLFSKQITTLEDMVVILNNTVFYTVLKEPIALEIEFGTRHFFINSTVLTNNDHGIVGVIVLFHDITKEKLLIQELEIKNKKISSLNTELMQSMMIDEAMIAQVERERLSDSIQKRIGEKLNDVIKKVNDLSVTDSNDADQKEQNLRKLAENLRSILADIRNVVYTSKNKI